jgi:hypothetical protein
MIKSLNILCSGLMMVLLIVVAGCSRKVVSSTASEVTDSIHVVEKTRDVLVHVPGDTVRIDRWIECDSVTNKPKPFIETKRGHKQASITTEMKSDGELISTATCDSLNEIITAKDKEIFELRTNNTAKTEQTIQYKKRGFDTFTNWYFAITALGLIAFIFHKLKYF